MLTVLDICKSEQWDQIVSSFIDYDTYWLSGYVKAFQIHGDGDPLLFYYEDSSVRGINVVMKRDVAKSPMFNGKIPESTYFDFSSPYGYGGWIIEGEKTESLFREYKKWCSENRIISEFVRFHSMIGNHEYSKDYYDVIQLGKVVHMDLSSPESIWANLTSKNRNMIRKAQKNGVTVHSGQTAELYDIFRRIYNETMDKDDAERYYYFKPAFYDSVRNDLKDNAKLFYAEKDEKIVATSIILAANGMMNYHLSGSIREYNMYAPSNLLLYEAALWGSTHGYKTFYLGGGVGSDEDSLFRFKKAFYRGDLRHFFIGKKIYDQVTYDKLIKVRGTVANSGFFPLYRA